MIFTVDTKYWSNIFFGPCILIIANRIILSSFFFQRQIYIKFVASPCWCYATRTSLSLFIFDPVSMCICDASTCALIMWHCIVEVGKYDFAINWKYRTALCFFHGSENTYTFLYTHPNILYECSFVQRPTLNEWVRFDDGIRKRFSKQLYNTRSSIYSNRNVEFRFSCVLLLLFLNSNSGKESWQ